jgi:D-psicose/D-tagatose/L-ribulose 3-epimerase
MHLSMHTWMRPEPLDRTAARAARYGYRSLLLGGKLEDFPADESGAALRRHGLRCWGAAAIYPGRVSFVSADAGSRRDAVDCTARWARLVAELGGSVVIVTPTPFDFSTPGAGIEQEWEWAVGGLRQVYSVTEQLGVRIAIEPLNRYESYLINRADQALALAEAVGPNCGVALDAFHMNIEESDMLAAITRVGGRLVSFDVSDNNRLPPGMGFFSWKDIVDALRSAGYSGPLVAEFQPPVDRVPATRSSGAFAAEWDGMTADDRALVRHVGSSWFTEEYFSTATAACARTLLPLIQEAAA